MFRGMYSVNMDAKGRLAIPARFRENLAALSEQSLVITIDPHMRCLALYPVAEWDLIQAKIESLPSLNAEARRLKHLLIAHAFDLDMDSNGRVLLAPELRKYAALEKKLTLIGQGKKVEVWSEENWQSRFESILDVSGDQDELPDEMKSLSF